VNCIAFYKLFILSCIMPFEFFESTVMMKILSCCPECVVVLFCVWVGGNLK
jgi:hypothetical protein